MRKHVYLILPVITAAFWMMPKDEQYYGQWPKCGEIDIMEVLGDSRKVNYGSLHYGEPHNQSQGSYSLSDGTGG